MRVALAPFLSLKPGLFQLSLVLTLSLALGVLSVGSAHAVSMGFDNISGNNAVDAAIGEAQLSVDVTDAGGNQVLFTFFNTGPAAASITDVYFDDGALLGSASLIDADEGIGGDPGVDFTELASPGILPSANNASPPFVSAGFSADSDPPVQLNGVNPGESLGILFDLTGMPVGTFADVIAQLTDGDLRIGLRVQGFDSEGSESFVNTPIPEPNSYVLFFAGLGIVGTAIRRRKS